MTVPAEDYLLLGQQARKQLDGVSNSQREEQGLHRILPASGLAAYDRHGERASTYVSHLERVLRRTRTNNGVISEEEAQRAADWW